MLTTALISAVKAQYKVKAIHVDNTMSYFAMNDTLKENYTCSVILDDGMFCSEFADNIVDLLDKILLRIKHKVMFHPGEVDPQTPSPF